MSRISRRTFAAAIGQMLAWPAIASARRRVPERRPTASRATGQARYFLQVILGGGIDAIYSFDPKERREVAPGVDAPVAARDIVTAGNIRLGPHVSELARWADRMAIIRSVSTYSAAHLPALAQVVGCKLGLAAYQVNTTLTEIIGSHRDTQAVSTISVGLAFPFGTGPRELGQFTIYKLLEMSPEEREACGVVLRAERDRKAAASRSAASAATIEGLDDLLRLLDRLKTLKGPASEENWSGRDEQDGRFSSLTCQFVLWLFENDLARSVRLHIGGWDTHWHNAKNQLHASRSFFPAFARLLREMESRTSGHRSLLDSTQIMIGSELGRFPEINPAEGKHHLPEAPYVLMGPGIRGGMIFGETGRKMEALPVDLRTGRPMKGGRMVDLDDVGVTVLTATGIDPKQHGYHGRLLGVLE